MNARRETPTNGLSCLSSSEVVDRHIRSHRRRGNQRYLGQAGGTRTFRGKNVVINTGTRATLEPIPGLAEAKPLTHIEALELDHIPKRSPHDAGRARSAPALGSRQSVTIRVKVRS
jgi:pyruvate/2-oxoglutarate dehydrogenase complex dihydrolipoamide dehydrogenase (E3) component